MNRYNKIETTPEIYWAIFRHHKNQLKVFGTISNPCGNQSPHAQMYTEWGFDDADFPIIAIDRRWDIDQKGKGSNERTSHYLIVAKE